jgi:hypothetical protein
MMLWFKKQQLSDSRDVKKSKDDIIESITKINPHEIKNTTQNKKSYSLWQRIKKVLWTS